MRAEHRTLAAVVEMIHTATLVHDDVLDEADVRRHQRTVNAVWGNEASVLLGDYLFTHAFHLASKLDSTWACREIGRATNIVCEGELRQIESRRNDDLSEAEYLEIIAAKTAELCACSCRLGAYYADADETIVERMTAFGRDVGIAFQIIDDLLDILGEEASMGKSLGTDLAQHKPTLPLIRLVETLGQDGLEALEQIRQCEPVDQRLALLPLLQQSDAIEYTREKANSYVESARRQLIELPPSAERDRLDQLAQFIVDREF